eukprot:2473486-Rhodomonas_salina.1
MSTQLARTRPREGQTLHHRAPDSAPSCARLCTIVRRAANDGAKCRQTHSCAAVAFVRTCKRG